MGTGVVVDTSYLITLADQNRENHQTADRYWRYFMEERVPVFLSTIVVSEFCIKQELCPVILRSSTIVPFNWDDALRAAELDFSSFDRNGIERDALKDDMKILAQAIEKNAAFVITDDKKSFFPFAQKLVASGKAGFKPIRLIDGFDIAFFNEGQRELDLEPE